MDMCGFSLYVCSVNNFSTNLQKLCLTPGAIPSQSFVKFKVLFLQQRGSVWGACSDLSLPFVCFLFLSLLGNLAPEPWLPLIPFSTACFSTALSFAHSFTGILSATFEVGRNHWLVSAPSRNPTKTVECQVTTITWTSKDLYRDKHCSFFVMDDKLKYIPGGLKKWEFFFVFQKLKSEIKLIKPRIQSVKDDTTKPSAQ